MHSVISLVEAKVENRAIVSYIINQSRANLSFFIPFEGDITPKANPCYRCGTTETPW